jgi:phosphoglycerol transferase MdoB-like AlkP superfamily enzyme
MSLGDVLYSFVNVDFSISNVIRLIVTLTLLIVVWGYSNNKPFLDAGTWRSLFYVLIVVYGFLAVMSFLSIGTAQFYEGVISVLATVPVLYCLYLYSNCKQSFWECDESKQPKT